jgi:hypothetical protein
MFECPRVEVKERRVNAMAQTMPDAGAVELACRAPSLHNSQPWRWVARGAIVDLFADPHRMVSPADRSGRAGIIGYGAVLDHFRVAMAVPQVLLRVDVDPDGEAVPEPTLRRPVRDVLEIRR